ncbi:MAG: penicillin-binding protein [Bacteroidota bacterium]|jgi:penicillin-binding protein 1C
MKQWFEKYKRINRNYQVAIGIGLISLIGYLFCLPSPLFEVAYSTVVYDRNGELLGARIADDQQWRFPTVDSVPEKYKICLLEFEDQYFNYHWGVNPLSLFRASKQNLKANKIVSGASTITMQTIRLARKEGRTFSEKIIEMILATRLEFSYSKNQIISLYASHAPMGGNVVGIEAAAWRYFGHKSSTLSWAETATLAVLPNSPASMHFGRNREKLLKKRNALLQRLYQKQMMGSVDYELAISEPLPFEPYALPQIAPHLVTRIYLEQGGKQVRTSVSKQRQLLVESILTRWNVEFSQNEIKNIAALVIDVEKNEVVAYCGNVHFERSASANQVDVIQAPRSTGSILKPFLYCAMLQEGLLLPHQLLADIPININGFTPKNFSLNYDGATPASEALARSLNIPFVVSLRKYGVPKFYNLLKTAGMTTLSRSPDVYGLSLILGGAEGKLWDVSVMYARMAQMLNDYNNDQNYYERKPISYIDAQSDQMSKEKIFKPLFNASSVWLTFDALTNLNRPEEIDWRSIPSIQKIAWKTGTSFGFRDGWAVGVSPKYVVGVWVGNADGEGRPGLTGAKTAGMVMFDIFNTLPSSKWFATPVSDLVQVEACKQSGYLAGVNCPESSIDTILVTKKGVEAGVCQYHIKVNVSDDFKYRVFENCAGARGITQTSWFVLPASWEWFYKEQHPSYAMLPPLSPECQSEDQTKTMEFIYPFANGVVSIPKQLGGGAGQIIFELAHRNPQTKVFWHLDETYVGETQNFHKKEISASAGQHKVTVVDENGNSTSIQFTVR